MSTEHVNQPTREIGQSGSKVPVVGLGCMGMSDFYGGRDKERAIATLRDALEIGVTRWDTSDMYGPHTNELLLSEVLKTERERVFLATKFGIMRNEKGEWLGINGRPEYARQCCEASLKRLGVEQIDLYYLHRPDPEVPIEDTVGELARLVEEGKVANIGISEHDVSLLRRAHKVHPIAAYQGELSLWTDVHEGEGNVIEACAELGVTFVAYSPLGRGFLTGAIQSPEDLADNDWRKTNPRFQGENFKSNLEIVQQVKAIAESIGATPAQVSLSWILAKYPHSVVIPGTTKSKRVRENALAAQVELSGEQMKVLDGLAKNAQGGRYA